MYFFMIFFWRILKKNIFFYFFLHDEKALTSNTFEVPCSIFLSFAVLSKKDEEKAEDERTFEVLKDVGNSIFECIQFTIDVPSLNENGKLPVLDLNLKLGL